jgi:hypothetical protein
VYAIPECNTLLICPMFFDRYETAAMLVAKGQGLIEVRIPSHKADEKPSTISFTYFTSSRY